MSVYTLVEKLHNEKKYDKYDENGSRKTERQMYEDVEQDLIKIAQDEKSQDREDAINDITTYYFLRGEKKNRFNNFLSEKYKHDDIEFEYIYMEFRKSLRGRIIKYNASEGSPEDYFLSYRFINDAILKYLADIKGLTIYKYKPLRSFIYYYYKFYDEFGIYGSIDEVIKYATEEDKKRAEERNKRTGKNTKPSYKYHTKAFRKVIEENFSQLILIGDNNINSYISNKHGRGTVGFKITENSEGIQVSEEKRDLIDSVGSSKLLDIMNRLSKIANNDDMFSIEDKALIIDIDSNINKKYKSMDKFFEEFFEMNKERLLYKSVYQLKEAYLNVMHKVLEKSIAIKNNVDNYYVNYDSVLKDLGDSSNIKFYTEFMQGKLNDLIEDEEKEGNLNKIIDIQSGIGIVKNYKEYVDYKPLSNYIIKIIENKFSVDVKSKEFDMYSFIREQCEKNCGSSHPIVRDVNGITEISLFADEKSARKNGYLLEKKDEKFSNEMSFDFMNKLHERKARKKSGQNKLDYTSFRGAIFALCFILGFDAKDVSFILLKVCKQLNFNPKDKKEVLYYYCFNNGIGYRDMQKLYIDLRDGGYFEDDIAREVTKDRDTRQLFNNLKDIRTTEQLKDYLSEIRELSRISSRSSLIELLRISYFKVDLLKKNPNQTADAIIKNIKRNTTKEERMAYFKSQSIIALSQEEIRSLRKYIYKGEGNEKNKDKKKSKNKDLWLNSFDYLNFKTKDIMNYQSGVEVPPRAIFLLLSLALFRNDDVKVEERLVGFSTFVNKYLRKAGYQDLYLGNHLDFVIASIAITDNPILGLRALLKEVEYSENPKK